MSGPVKRRTTCPVEGHGTNCEVAQERATRYARTTEERLAGDFEQAAEFGSSTSESSDG